MSCLKELFNLCYTSLCNVIEQIFRVVKRKFKILGTIAEYLINTQIHLVLGLLALYNFIHSQEGIQDNDQDEDILDNIDIKLLDKGIATKINAKREQIAKDMWKDYCDYIRRDI